MFVLLGSALPPAQAESARSLAQKASDFYHQERFQEAIDGYREAIARDPDSPLIRYNLGTALARDAHYDEAGRVLENTARNESPYSSDAWFNLGVARADEALDADPGIRPLLKSSPRPEDLIPPQAVAAIDPEKLQQSIDGLDGAMQAFRRSIIDGCAKCETKYNYEVAHQMQQRLIELKKQQQQQNQNQKQDKNNQQPQDQQEQDQQRQDQDQNQNQNQEQQQQQDQQQGDKQEQPQPDQQQQKNDQRQKQDQQQQQQQAGKSPDERDQQQANAEQENAQPLTPEQMDAQRLLELLEEARPEQFKQLFRFQGVKSARRTERDW
jgi:hypothetical protein